MFKLKILFFVMLSLTLVGAPAAAQVTDSCPLTGITIDSQNAGGGIDGPGVVGRVYGTGCQVILEVTNTRSYWVNLRVTPVGNGLVLKPDGDLATSLMGYRVLPPLGSIRYNATFTAAGQSVMAILDGTASIDQGAREMTYVQAMVDLLSLTGVLDSALTIDLLVEYYPALRNTLSVSPNLQEAFLNLTEANYQGFIQAMQRAAAEGEVTVFGQTLMDVGAAVAADRLGSFIDDALGAGYLNVLVVIFSNYGAVFSRIMSQPAGFIIFNAEGASAPLVTDPDVPALNPVTRSADWTPVVQDFDGVPMVQVPPGCFMMGMSDAEIDDLIQQYGDQDWIRAFGPQHRQCIDEPFWIDLTEVTQADFERLGGVAANNSYFDGQSRPVEQITWFEARDFCALRGARLPTEAEWEYVARGPDGLVYPWGDEFVSENAVWSENSNDQTANVGSRPSGASWVGALDMSGNAWEWVSSLYEPYPYSADDGREADTGDRTDVLRVLRGGSLGNGNAVNLRSAVRGWYYPDLWNRSFGFRCARSS